MAVWLGQRSPWLGRPCPFSRSTTTAIFPEPEGTAFCEILSNSFNAWQNRLHGDILLNGVSVSPARLQDRVAYVRRNNAFGADMSVRQTMLFHSFLREPGTHARSRDARGRVSNSRKVCPNLNAKD